MSVKIHFENLTSGMRAKLDTRYKAHNDYVYTVRKVHGNGIGASLLEDAVGKHRPAMAKTK
jgi:hypothetical protein